MRIVVDAMGGDNAPGAVVGGCTDAALELGVEIVLVGDAKVISDKLSEYTFDRSKIEVVNASEVISNNEAPVSAIRKKKDSSMVVGLKLVRDGGGDAFISAGSTGALLTGATLIVGRIKGIDRPAIGPIFPGGNGTFMVIDSGANAECKPKNLVQFAVMGNAYYKQVLGVPNPKVGLINIGAEEEKGNTLTKAAYQLLKGSGLNFVGNVEPRDITQGNVQVLVCDGFVGNTVLKMYEGTASMIFHTLKSEIISGTISKIGALLLKRSISSIKAKFDYTEYGGAPFLGVDGPIIKAHGSSNAKAFKNAIKQAKLFVENGVLSEIKSNLSTAEDGSERTGE